MIWSDTSTVVVTTALQDADRHSSEHKTINSQGISLTCKYFAALDMKIVLIPLGQSYLLVSERDMSTSSVNCCIG